MIQCDVDEISFVFLPDFNEMMSDYEAFALDICYKIDELLELEKYTVNFKLNEKGFAGYNHIINFDEFEILLCFNTDSPRMGIFLKFSGQGLKHYMKRREEDNQKISYRQLVQKFFELENYFSGSCRVSKIDFAIDFIDEGLKVNQIHQELNKSTIKSKYVDSFTNTIKLRKNQSNISTINTNNRVETIYVGSKANKGNSLLLRIYDKKLEQEKKKGIYYDEALKCDDWVRFEMSIRQAYANQTGLDILKCRNDKELSSLIFQRFTDKYLFFKNDELWHISKVMLEYVSTDFDLLRSKPRRKNDLLSTYIYLLKNSGLESFLYKIDKIYGKESIQEFFKHVLIHFKTKYKPSPDTIIFLNNRKDELKKEKKPWDVFK